MVIVRTIAADWPGGDDAGDSVFVDQLSGLARGIQQDGEGIKTADLAAQLDAAHQINRDPDAFLAHLVQKHVLEINCFRHLLTLLLVFERRRKNPSHLVSDRHSIKRMKLPQIWLRSKPRPLTLCVLPRF